MKSQLQVADAAYREGRFTEAEAVYLKVKDLDPKNVRVLERLGALALWNNRVEEAEHYLKNATDCAPGTLKLWPFNAQLKMLLAMTYYRMDNFPESARFFKEAAGSIALGPFQDIKALGQHLALFGKETPYTIEGPEETQVGFVITDPLPVIEVSVNNSQPLLFFIDTGAAEIVLDMELARRIGAEFSGTLTGTSAGPKGRVGLGKVASITIGDLVIKNIPIHTLDTNPFSAVFSGLNVKGIVGTRLLMHFLGTLDYVNGALTLRRKTPTNLRRLDKQVETQKTKVIPFWLIQTHYIVAWGMVNGKGPMLFLVDTGLAGKGFTAPESVLREAGIIIDWTKAQQGIAGFGKVKGVDVVLDQLTLGSRPNEIVEHNVPGAALEKSVEVLGNRLGFWIGGLISHQFFRNYALTLDFAGMRLLCR